MVVASRRRLLPDTISVPCEKAKRLSLVFVQPETATGMHRCWLLPAVRLLPPLPGTASRVLYNNTASRGALIRRQRKGVDIHHGRICYRWRHSYPSTRHRSSAAVLLPVGCNKAATFGSIVLMMLAGVADFSACRFCWTCSCVAIYFRNAH